MILHLLARARRLLPFVIALSCTNIGRAADEPLPELLATFRHEFVAITPGQGEFTAGFTMGRDDGDAAERPAHRVGLDYDFAVARYEVPQNLWQAVMGENPSKWKGPRNSVEEVSWDDCQKFCQRLTQLLARCSADRSRRSGASPQRSRVGVLHTGRHKHAILLR